MILTALKVAGLLIAIIFLIGLTGARNSFIFKEVKTKEGKLKLLKAGILYLLALFWFLFAISYSVVWIVKNIVLWFIENF